MCDPTLCVENSEHTDSKINLKSKIKLGNENISLENNCPALNHSEWSYPCEPRCLCV